MQIKLHAKIIQCHYDDVNDKKIIKKSICIFDFNPEKNSIHLIQENQNFNGLNIYMNSNNEIIIANKNDIQIFNKQ